MKEIQRPQMRFTFRSTSTLHPLKPAETCRKTVTAFQGARTETPEPDKEKAKVYLKSAYSMLLKLGVLKYTSESPRAKFSRGGTTGKHLDDFGDGFDRQTGTLDPLTLAKKLIAKALSSKKKLYNPQLTNGGDPVLSAAEKLLVQTNVIQRKRIVKSPMGRAAGNNQKIMREILSAGRGGGRFSPKK